VLKIPISSRENFSNITFHPRGNNHKNGDMSCVKAFHHYSPGKSQKNKAISVLNSHHGASVHISLTIEREMDEDVVPCKYSAIPQQAKHFQY